QRAGILDGAHAAADGKRHEAYFGGAADDVDHRAAGFVAGADVEEAEFVGAGGVIGAGLLDRIACVDQVDEVDALDHTAVRDVEAGDDAGADGHIPSPSPSGEGEGVGDVSQRTVPEETAPPQPLP